MYAFAKNLLKKIVPQGFLFRHETFFRWFLIPFYAGKTYQCTICQHRWKHFVNHPDDLLCPYCGSRGRTRRLYQLLYEKDALHGRVLHFSPSRALYRKFKKAPGFTYVSTDFENEFLADYRIDITQIDFPADYFDTIICYHILEHVPDDEQAMRELARVLKPGGQCFVQTPFREGGIYEDDSITGKAGRLRAFGQEDHVRVYSVSGLQNRLEKAGLAVQVLHFDAEKRPFGLPEEEVFWVRKGKG